MVVVLKLMLLYDVWIIVSVVMVSEERRGVAVVELLKKEGCGLGLTVTGMHVHFLLVMSCFSPL